jgi:hypothetical protein
MIWKPKKWMPVVVWPKFIKWWSNLNGFGVAGVTLPLLIIINEYTDRSEKWMKELINHESIHITQQIELLVIGFYLLYGLNYAWNRWIKGMSHKEAYLAIVFEQEARAGENNFEYLDNRKFYAWLKFL